MFDHVTENAQQACIPGRSCRQDWMYSGGVTGKEWADGAFLAHATVARSSDVSAPEDNITPLSLPTGYDNPTDNPARNYLNESSQSADGNVAMPEQDHPSNDADVVFADSRPNAPRVHVCPHTECRTSFTRREDLKRHVQSRHLKTKPHVCPVLGCFKKQQKTAFSRSDKLVDHLFAVHGHYAPCVCPDAECDTKQQMSLSELYAHLMLGHNRVTYPHPSLADQLPVALAKLCDASRQVHKCPVYGCRKRLHVQEVPEHLLAHDESGVRDGLKALDSSIWCAMQEGCQYQRQESSATDCGCLPTGIRTRCPVCHSVMDTCAFDEHLEAMHLLKQIEVEHFTQYKRHCDPENVRPPHNGRWSVCTVWKRLRWFNSDEKRCPVCDTALSEDGRNCFADHHLSMLQDCSYLKPYRNELLRLYPGIVMLEALWDDLKPHPQPADTSSADPSTIPQNEHGNIF